MNPVSTAIVVLNVDKKEDTLACLDSVYRLDDRSFDVVVVDNGSRDGSPDEIARAFPHLHLIRNETNLGASSGRNMGFRYACEHIPSPYVLFLDNDTLVERGFLGHLVRALEGDASAGLAFGKGYAAYPSRTILSVGMRFNPYTGSVRDVGSGEPDRGQHDQPAYEHGCASFGVLARCEVIEQLGGFDERYDPYGFEDLDLCLRAGRIGWRTRYVPEAVIHHKGCKKGRGPIAAYERSKAKNYLLLLREHTTAHQKACLALCLPMRALRVAGDLAVRGQLRMLRSHAHGLLKRPGTPS